MRTLILGVACAIAASFLVASPAYADPTCDTYLLIGARGTDEAPQGSDPYTQANWDGSGILANRVFTTLEPIVAANGGTMARYGVRYAADMDLGGFATEIVNAEYNWSFDNEWDAGVAVGSADLVDKIESMYPVCPGTKYILVGYSQGADVVGEAIEELSVTLRSRVAATALFGDPRFNPNDTAANMGNYVDHNSGMFAARPFWSTMLSSPVFSYCLWMDFACQSRQYIDATIQPYVWPWAYAAMQFGSPLGAHAQYQAAGQMEATGVAQSIASALSMTFTLEDDPAVDVVFLIDSTPNATGAITELKARSSELTAVVDEASDNYRFAVVDYKGASTGNPYVTRVAQDFTTDPADVDEAIDDLVVSGGNPSTTWWDLQTASGHSGVLTAAGLDWRDYARKLIILLSSSRVNEEDTWHGSEEITLVSPEQVDAALASEWDMQLYAVSYGDDWGAQGWVSSPASHSGGNYRTSAGNGSPVNEMLIVLNEALRRVDLSMGGPILARPGDAVTFGASSRSIVAAADPTYVWSVCEVGDDPIIVSRAATVITDPPTCGVYYPTPSDVAEDEGNTAEFEFTDTGLYRVGVSVRVDPGDQYWLSGTQMYWTSQEVTVMVLDYASAAPSSSLIHRQLDGNSLTLALTPDIAAAQTVDYWELRDPSDSTVERFVLPADDQTVTVLDTTSTDWTLVPANEFGTTPPRESVLATDLSVTEAGPGGDAVIEIGGAVNEELAAIASGSPTGSVPLDGAYASVWAGDGWRIDYPMDDANASLTFEDSRWSASFDVGDDVDANGDSMNDIVTWGLGSALSNGSDVTVQVDGEPVTIHLDGALLNQGIFDPYGIAPEGVEMNVEGVDPLASYIDVTHDGAYVSTLIPAWSEANDPTSYNWEQAIVSDIRAFIGDVEYVFSGDVRVHSIADPMTTDAESLRLTIEGSPGNGSLEILREFIQHGTVAFRINNGDFNVINLAATPTEAESYYPSP